VALNEQPNKQPSKVQKTMGLKGKKARMKIEGFLNRNDVSHNFANARTKFTQSVQINQPPNPGKNSFATEAKRTMTASKDSTP
jgi:hypothetical protein